MLRLAFDRPVGTPLTLLCLGAHADDIEIGAGGTILTLLRRYPGSSVRWVVFSAVGARGEEARASARDFLSAAASCRVDTLDARDGFFPAEFLKLKEQFESLKREIEPDLILTHTRHDGHQDHRTLAGLTWNTWRDHLILGYEIPKYDPDTGNPNVLVPLEPGIAEEKVAALMRHFATQRARRWFVPETFHALMRLRGLQAAAPSGLAEAFFGPKLWL
jgi:LmbE family N-acetylglucosaminyl deacetylase